MQLEPGPPGLARAWLHAGEGAHTIGGEPVCPPRRVWRELAAPGAPVRGSVDSSYVATCSQPGPCMLLPVGPRCTALASSAPPSSNARSSTWRATWTCVPPGGGGVARSSMIRWTTSPRALQAGLPPPPSGYPRASGSGMSQAGGYPWAMESRYDHAASRSATDWEVVGARRIIRSLRLFPPAPANPLNGLGLVEQKAIFRRPRSISRT